MRHKYHFNLNNHQKVPNQHEEGTFFSCTFLLGCPYLYQPSRNKRATFKPYNFRQRIVDFNQMTTVKKTMALESRSGGLAWNSYALFQKNYKKMYKMAMVPTPAMMVLMMSLNR